jgi:hypothetical protein
MNIENISLRRMETMLKVWEQILQWAFSELMLVGPEKIKGAVAEYRNLRRAVLQRNRPTKNGQFRMSDEVATSYFANGCLTYDMFPEMLIGWSHSSRRVFSLTPDMQKSLEMTSSGKISWNEILPPFPYFIVSLPVPIMGDHGNTLDTLLVHFEKGVLEIIVIGSELEVFKPMKDSLRRRLGSALASRSYSLMQSVKQELMEGGHCYVPSTLVLKHYCSDFSRPVLTDDFSDERVSAESVETDKDGLPTVSTDKSSALKWLNIRRIVVNLCLHLAYYTRRTETQRLVSLWEPVKTPTVDTTAVTDKSLICSVQHEQTLTPEEERIFSLIRTKGVHEACMELCCHFRSAHYRRPPYTADDPLQAKTVHVRWAKVNEHRAPRASLLGGTNTHVV